MSSTVDDAPHVPKLEPFEEEYFSESSPEPEEQSLTQEPAQIQKRKGGRKPIYATSEERKQRNRQAQAAFRERRTEYIKQLETTIKQHEEALQSLQQSHRSAADECLMLRYKNSLLERILLEKGIDVQAELKSKTEGSHIIPHAHPPSGAPNPSPVQRAIMNRQNQTRRSNSGASSQALRPRSSHTSSTQSPRLQPTPSHMISPTTTRSPVGMPKGGMVPPSMDLKAQQQQQPPPPHDRSYSHQAPSKISIPSAGQSTLQTPTPSTADGSRSSEMGSVAGTTQTSFYPSPFQAHIEQLGKLARPLLSMQQEYDAHADMLDDENPDDREVGPGPYPQTFNQHSLPPNQGMPMGMQGQPPMQQMQPMSSVQQMSSMQPPPITQPMDPNNPTYASMNPGFDPYDPSLDADPFGLTASMHFPTQFTFQESSMRR